MNGSDEETSVSAVIIRYATAVDSRDWDLLRTCFTGDFIGEFGPAGTWRGPDEAVSYMIAGSKAAGPSLHRITNIVVNIAGATATARSYVDAIMMPKDTEGQGFQSIAYFDDVLIRASDGWRIKSRRMTRIKFTAT